jgi:hypothetical protein
MKKKLKTKIESILKKEEESLPYVGQNQGSRPTPHFLASRPSVAIPHPLTCRAHLEQAFLFPASAPSVAYTGGHICHLSLPALVGQRPPTL